MRKLRSNKTGLTNSGSNKENLLDPRVKHLAEALIDPVKRSKLIRIHNALNKRVTGLIGETVDLRDSVRYGINGFTFREIGELLT